MLKRTTLMLAISTKGFFRSFVASSTNCRLGPISAISPHPFNTSSAAASISLSSHKSRCQAHRFRPRNAAEAAA